MLPGLAPLLLPWLVVLGLLALKPNRIAAAWLIWLPLGCVMALSFALPAIQPSAPDFVQNAIAALAIGLAAVWLLASYLRRQHGFLTFLCVLLALAIFSLMAAAFRVSGVEMMIETLQIGMFLGMGILVTSAAVGLAGLISRRHYRPLALYLWLLLLLTAIWLLITAPFFLIIQLVSDGAVRNEWLDFLIPVLVVAIVHFAILLPFLILSSASPFYRERLKALLHVKPEIPPAVNPAEPDPAPHP